MSDRLTDLEIHYSHLQALLDELNTVVIRQQQQIDQLQQSLAQLRRQLEAGSSGQIASLREETPPPHY
ncbi:MAG: SlyX family protein [Gammaproteobacteria bacterium]|nr:SlyX family protein [Gammaproteobacteria bacterium]